MTPRAAGIIDACRAARDALALHLAEAERAAALPDLQPDDAAFVAARLEQLRRIASGLEKRMQDEALKIVNGLEKRMADAREATP